MALYDDLDNTKQADKVADRVAGWSNSGIKLLQSQLQLKKVSTSQQPKTILRKPTTVVQNLL